MAKQKSSGWLDKYDEGGTVGQFLRGLVTPETKRSNARAAISTAPKEQSYTSKAWDAATHPVTAFKHLVKDGRLPNNFAAAAPLGIDTALDLTGLNPFGWADMGVQAVNAGKKMVDGTADIMDLVSMPLNALGMAPGMKTIDKTLTKTAEAVKNNKALTSSFYKLAQKYPQIPYAINNTIPQAALSVKDLKKNTVNKVVGSILDNPNVSNKVKEAVKSTKSGFVYALSKDDPRLYSTAKNALGKEITVASHRELKDAFEESLDKLKYKPDTIIDPFASQDYEKALGLDVRMKFADRMKMFTDPDYANTISGNFGDLRSSKSIEFLKNSGFDIDKLNPKERALMDAYAHGYDQYINSRVGNLYNKEFVDYYKNLSDEFNTAVQKNKFNNEGMLNRTTANYSVNLFDPSTNQTIGTKYRNELSVGDVFKDDSFLSTSLPHSFYNDGNIERIVVPSGGKQSYMFPNSVRSSPFANEEEVILPKGLIRRVEDAIPSGTRNEIVTSILNPYKNGGWLDKYNDGGPVQENYNDASVSYPDNFVGEGIINGPNWKSPAWGGQFQMGGSMPGAVGFTYARTGGIPSNGPYAKKTKASAQNGTEMKFYQEGLDWTPKSISKNGSVIKDDMGQWAHPGEITEIGSNQITMQGVPYPVLGISDTGDTQMMYPNEEYQYNGSSVTEYPIMKEGGALQLTKLDQLTNFTNYNTKQPGGWLDKYQD